jgi:hypothetical protein
MESYGDGDGPERKMLGAQKLVRGTESDVMA